VPEQSGDAGLTAVEGNVKKCRLRLPAKGGWDFPLRFPCVVVCRASLKLPSTRPQQHEKGSSGSGRQGLASSPASQTGS
jgi:hypothetical protein